MSFRIFYGRKIQIGLKIEDTVFINTIDYLNKELIKNGVNPSLIVPIDSLHITLASFEFGSETLENQSVSNRVDFILNHIGDKFKFKDRILRPNRYSYSENSQSINLLFDKHTILFLTSVREALINCALSNKIIFQDTRKFIPHYSVSLVSRQLS